MRKAIYTLLGLLLMAAPAVQAQLKSTEEVATAALAAKREVIKAELIKNYMAVKQSLIVSDSVQAPKAALQFISSLDQFKFKKLTLPEMNEATSLRREIRDLALEISKTTSINKQRKAFSALSAKMWVMAPKVKPMETALYQQVCPMTGDTWLSMEKEIKNPYYPKNMLTCGEVKQSI